MKLKSNLFLFFIFNYFWRNILYGSAFGLTNVIVSYPSLSNILYDLQDDSPLSFHQTLLINMIQIKEKIKSIIRILHGIDSMFIWFFISQIEN